MPSPRLLRQPRPYAIFARMIFMFIVAFLLVPAEQVASESLILAEVAETPSEDTGDYYRGIVQVKFRDTYRMRLRAGVLIDLDEQATQDDLMALQHATQRAAQTATWSRAHDVEEETLDMLRAQGEANTGETLADINNYYHLVLPDDWSAQDAIAQLESNPLVERVMRIPVAIPANFTFEYQDPGGITGNPASDAYQRYLDPAPDGIDARYAWNGGGGTGSGISICDIEQDHNPDHADLPPISIQGALITFPGQDDNHGTAVLGIVAARNDGLGVTGIAYNAKLKFAYGLFNNVNNTPNATNSTFFLHHAITRCTAAVGEGGVILIEAQIGGPNRPEDPVDGDQFGLVPTEWDESVYDVIKLAVANGITVVEAAGNGQQNLDDAAYQTGNDNHFPFLAGNDSGAIIVGAGKSPAYGATAARSAHGYSNYGQTVDIQGWGDGIVTTGYGTLFPGGANPNLSEKNQWYALSFGGTSGASPIVTGAVAVVQSTYKQVHGTYMTPAQVRTLLRDTGTPQQGANNIGPFPDLRSAIEQIYDDADVGLTVAAPGITPASGTYAMPMQTTITFGTGQNSSNTNIRYTLNGSEPTPDSFIFLPSQGDLIYLNYDVVLKAKAFIYDPVTKRSFESPTTTRSYTSSTPKVSAPVISPSGGTYNAPHNVTLTTATDGATIRYRTDGRTPSFFYPGTLYEGPISLGAGEYELVARGYKDGYYKSDATYSGEIYISPTVLPSPIIYPDGGTFNGSVTIYLGSTVLGATIRYSFDGEPDENSPIFSEPILVETTDAQLVTTLRAKVFLDPYTPSPSTSATFTVVGQPSPPTILPANGEFTGTVAVNMSTDAAGGIIRYTINNAEPTSYSAIYSGPFNLGPGTHTVKAKTFLAGATSSNTTTRDYTVYTENLGTVETPRAIPGGGNHTISVTIQLETDTNGADIHYVLVGDNLPDVPDQADPLYDPNNPIVLEYDPGVENYFLRAKAFKTGYTPSDFVHVVTRVFTAEQTVDTPTVDLPGGVYTEPIQISIDLFRNPPFTVPTIYYTTDGTDPFVPTNTAGKIPLLKLNLSEATQVKAMGAQLGRYDSELLDESYEFVCATPEITSGGIYTGSAQVELSTMTPDAILYYTTDGSAPIESSMVYTDPFTLDVGTTTVRAKCFYDEFDPSNEVVETYVVQPSPIAPTFIVQPTDVEANAGDSVTFTVVVTGTPDPTIQWQFKGDDIGGETEPELELHDVNDDHLGGYRAIATNAAGATSSTTATLSLALDAIEGLAATNDGPTQLGTPTGFEATLTSGTNVSYTWDYGDGQSGSGRTPSHTYAISGTFVATVTAINQLSVVTATTEVVVTDDPAEAIAGLTATNDGPTAFGASTSFEATLSSGTFVTYTWDFGNGQSGSGRTPSHTYAMTGTYTATVTAINPLGVVTATTAAIVSDAPTEALAGLSASNDGPTALGEPTSFAATLTSGTFVTYAWDFGDGQSGSGRTPSHTYAITGTYIITVTATNSLGSTDATTVAVVTDDPLFAGDRQNMPFIRKSE